MSTDTRLQLQNTLAFPHQFDPRRPVPLEVKMKFEAYIKSADDPPINLNIEVVHKVFFQTLLKEAEWLIDSVYNFNFTLYYCPV